MWFYKHLGKSSTNWSKPLLVDEITTFDPPHVSPRITAQSARFTVHPDAEDPEPDWPGVLLRIVLPVIARPLLRQQLRSLGINRAVLFPDLDGIASDLNRLFGFQSDEGMDSPDDHERFRTLCKDLGTGASSASGQSAEPQVDDPTPDEESPEQ